MAAIEEVGLVAAKIPVHRVALGGELLDAGLRRAPVVAGEHDQRVARDAVAIEGGQHLTHGPVGLHHKVSVEVQAAASDPFLVGCDRRVR